MGEFSENQKMARAAWLYYVAGLNQEATSKRLGLTRARVNKLLQQARETGIVSITLNNRDTGLLPVEEALRQAFGLEFCIATPSFGLTEEDQRPDGPFAGFAMRAAGTAGARFLRDWLTKDPGAIIGTGWGRTLAHLSRQMSGVRAPNAKFVSLMGSLTANSTFNPFEVVQSLAQVTGGQGFFLPVPFIADTAAIRDILLSQRAVERPLELARSADLSLISVGELTERSLLRQQELITLNELAALRDAGAVGDTNGIFFDNRGQPVDHELNRRSIAASFQDLRRATTVVLSGGFEKVDATAALMHSGVVKGLIIDGDSALRLLERAGSDEIP